MSSRFSFVFNWVGILMGTIRMPNVLPYLLFWGMEKELSSFLCIA
jgi:hypothetical protein